MAYSLSYAVSKHKIKLQNITNNTAVLSGSSEYDTLTSRSQMTGCFTINGTSNFKVYHFCSKTNTGDGAGLYVGSGLPEVYSDIKIWKVS